MKTKYFYPILLIAYVIFIASCDKNADDMEIPDYTPKLVLHAFISPSDTVLNVHVGTTNNIYGEKKYPGILPVFLQLEDNGQLIPFSERDSFGFCSLKYTIEPGKEYKITAHCDGYPDAYGICKVPKIENINLSLDTLSYVYKTEFDTIRVIKITAKFTDIPNENNYYNIYGRGTGYSTYDSTSYYTNIGNGNEDDIYSLKTNELLSDHLMDGKEIITYFPNFPYPFYNLQDSFLLSLKFTAQILCTDEDYYRYHVSLSKYNDGDDPFTEFSPVYSNIIGGYGIIASYILHEKTIVIK